MTEKRRPDAETPKRRSRVDGGTVEGKPHARSMVTACNENARQEFTVTMEEGLSRGNMLAAYHRVFKNQGAPGVDGITVDELWDLCLDRWEAIREELLNGTYVPSPVRRVEIPKPGGKGVRMLGIPTDRSRATDSTGPASGFEPVVRTEFLGLELRLPSGT